MAGFLTMSLLAGNGIDLLAIVAVTRSENLITQRTSYGLGCTHFSLGSRGHVYNNIAVIGIESHGVQ